MNLSLARKLFEFRRHGITSLPAEKTVGLLLKPFATIHLGTMIWTQFGRSSNLNMVESLSLWTVGSQAIIFTLLTISWAPTASLSFKPESIQRWWTLQGMKTRVRMLMV